mmetsp:Transcript_6133/g.15722  ORF Transcript_6133/g.15722 Transcript_6133/m.15722 type:complete len:517 (-) Transcript_6133:32-1582(-)
MQRSCGTCGRWLAASVVTAWLLPTTAVLRVPNPGLANVAPWGVAPPQTGQLIRQSVVGLKETHHSLADVSQELMGIQSEMGVTEQNLFGKVVDAQTAANLVDQQMLIVAANDRAREDITALQAKVRELSALMAGARSEKFHWKTTVATLRAAIARNDEEALEHKRLMEAEEQLKYESTASAKKAESVQQEAVTLEKLSQEEAAKQAQLRAVIANASQVAQACDGEEGSLELKLKGERSLAGASESAVNATEKVHEQALNATSQRMKAEMAILASQVHDAEQQSQQAMKMLQFAQTQLQTLEKSLTFDVQDVHARTEEASAELRGVRKQIATTDGLLKAGSARKVTLHQQIVQLSQEISPIETATLEAENEALQNEVHQATALLARSMQAEAIAEASAMQEQAQVGAYKQAALLSAQSVVVAREQSKREVASAVELAEATKTNSEAHVQKANAAIEAMCRAQWAQRAAEKDKQIDSCRSMKQDLENVLAQQSTLEQTLRSQAMARESAEEQEEDEED